MATMEYRSEQARALMMGPSSLRIAEELCGGLSLGTGSRILDLGCGRGLSTLYLASRYPDSLIFAADLWIDPDENLRTFREAGVDSRVIPLKAEAAQLPFAKGYFDAVVTIDSYHYFGTDPGFLDEHLAGLLAPGGTLLMAVPGWKTGHEGGVPQELSSWIEDDMGFRTAAWWSNLWSGSSMIETASAGDLACHAEAWADWLTCDNEHSREDRPMMEADGGHWMAIVSLVGRRSG